MRCIVFLMIFVDSYSFSMVLYWLALMLYRFSLLQLWSFGLHHLTLSPSSLCCGLGVYSGWGASFSRWPHHPTMQFRCDSIVWYFDAISMRLCVGATCVNATWFRCDCDKQTVKLDSLLWLKALLSLQDTEEAGTTASLNLPRPCIYSPKPQAKLSRHKYKFNK